MQDDDFFVYICLQMYLSSSFFLSAASIALPYLKNYPYYQHQILGTYVGLEYAVQCKISVTSGHFKMSK